jgi:hypothetical protein
MALLSEFPVTNPTRKHTSCLSCGSDTTGKHGYCSICLGVPEWRYNGRNGRFERRTRCIKCAKRRKCYELPLQIQNKVMMFPYCADCLLRFLTTIRIKDGIIQNGRLNYAFHGRGPSNTCFPEYDWEEFRIRSLSENGIFARSGWSVDAQRKQGRVLKRRSSEIEV